MWRRFVPVLMVLVAVSLVGCSNWGKKKAENYPDNTYPTTTPVDYGAQPSTYATPVANGDYTGATGNVAGRTHIVGRKETLFSIARQYYNNDASKWKAIYAANRNEIGDDPNHIRVGQKLIIP